jgi:RNA polymerase sigma-70 factor (ECF subfamily)
MPRLPPDEPRADAQDASGGPIDRARARPQGRDAADGPDGEVELPPEIAAAVNSASRSASNREARRREAEEDRGLVIRAKKGEEAAFRELVERHQRPAYAVALTLVRDENDARELVQDAFLRVYRGLGSFEGKSSFFTWLYRIINNLAIDLMRKPGRHDVGLSENHGAEEEPAELPLVSRIDGADPIDVMRRREIAVRIQTALDALPPYHRGVIVMREVEGMSYEEMAQAMGVSKGTIMSRLFHARQKLQRALADCYSEQVQGRRGDGDLDPEEDEGGPAAREAS